MLRGTSNASGWLAKGMQTKDNSQTEVIKECWNLQRNDRTPVNSLWPYPGQKESECRSELSCSSPVSAQSAGLAEGGRRSRKVRGLDLHRPFTVAWLPFGLRSDTSTTVLPKSLLAVQPLAGTRCWRLTCAQQGVHSVVVSASQNSRDVPNVPKYPSYDRTHLPSLKYQPAAENGEARCDIRKGVQRSQCV